MNRILFFILLFVLPLGASAQRYARTFATVDDMLAAFPNDVSTNAVVMGRYAPDDGGGGEYYWNGTSTTTTNGGMVLKPNNANGRWIGRSTGGEINVKRFGAKGDGTTDDTSAIQDAINYAQTAGNIGTVYIPNATFRVSNLTVLRGTKIRGAGWNSRLKGHTGSTGWMITIDGNAAGAQLNYESNMAPLSIQDVYLDGNDRMSDYGAIYMAYVDQLHFQNLVIYEFDRSALYFDKSVRESNFDAVSIRYCGNKTATNNHGAGWPAVSIIDWETNAASVEDKHNGLRFSQCEVVFSMGDNILMDTYQISSGGRKISNISLDNCWIHGWSAGFTTVKYFSMMSTNTAMQDYSMFKVGAARDIRLTSTRFQLGGRGKPILEFGTSALGGTTVSPWQYSVENAQVYGCYLNSAYSTTRIAGEVGILATAGYGVIKDNILAGLYAGNTLSGGWAELSESQREDSGVTFSGVIPSSRITGTMQELGNRPYTVHIRFRMPTSKKAINSGLFSLGTIAGSVSAPGLFAYWSTGGSLTLIQLGPTAPDTRTIAVPYGSLESLLGKLVDMDVIRSGTNMTLYLNGGSAIGATYSTAASPSGYDMSLPSTKWSIGIATSGNLWPSTITEFRVANRAFSGSELGAPVNPIDMWGSTNALTSGLLTVGAKYRIVAQSTSDFTTVGASANTVGTEFTATGTGSGLLDASNSVERLGWVLDANLSGGSSTTVYDRSPNNLDGIMSGEGVKWVNQQEAASGGGVTSIAAPDNGVAFDGANASSYVGGNFGTIGTQPFTIHERVVFPSTLPTNTIGMFTIGSNAGTVSTTGIGLEMTTTGVLRFFLYGATGSDYRYAEVDATTMSAYLGKEVDMVVTRTNTTVAIYANGSSLSYTETTGGTPPAWSGTVSGSKYNVGLFTSGQVFGGSISIFRVANRALSSTEVSSILRGTTVADYGGDLSVKSSGNLSIGRRYRIASQTDGDFVSAGSANNTVGTEFVATATGGGTLLDAGDTAYKIGWVLDVDLKHIVGTVAYDKSGNSYNGTLTGNGVVPISPFMSSPVDFTGDSGAGGIHGLVPAPASGDAAAYKFLKASGGWATVPVTNVVYQDKGVALDGINASSYVGGDIGSLSTRPFTIHERAVFPASAPSTAMGLFTLGSSVGTVSTFGVGAVITTSGRFQFFLYGSTGSDYRYADVDSALVAPYLGKEVDVVITRSSTTLSVYFNGNAMTTTEVTAGTPPTWADTVTSSKYNIGLFTSGQVFGGSISIFRVANRSLSAAEVTNILRGPFVADVGGSFTVLNSGLLTIGKRYRIASRTDGDFVSVGSANNTVGTEFVATGTGGGTLLDAGDTAWRIGWALDVDLDRVVGVTASDKSGNAYTGTLTGNGIAPISPLMSSGGGSGITALTGDVTASGSGSVAATIPTNSVTNAKLVDVPTSTFKGRTTAGYGSPEDLTATQATALLNSFVGDSGAGGTKGLVPTPAAGDAAAGKFLKASGSWAVPAGGGDALTTNPLSQFAATTSAQLSGVLSDETGSGAAVFGTSPTFITPTLGAASATSLSIGSTGTIDWNSDTYLYRDTTGQLALRNGANNMGFYVYNSAYVSSTSYERAALEWNSSGTQLTIGSQKAGAGANRNVNLVAGGTSILTLSANTGNVTHNVGSATFSLSSSGIFAFGTRLAISSSAGGVLEMYNASGTDFSRLQLGTASATAAATEVRGQSGTGTDKVGGDLAMSGGLGTGTNKSGAFVVKGGLRTATTSSTAQSQGTRAVWPAAYTDLTETTATTLFTVTVGTANYIGMTIDATVFASDATDHQALHSTILVNTGNKAGTIATTGISQTDCGTTYASSGTLTPITYTLVDNGSGVLAVKCTATSSLTQTILRCKWSITALNSNDAATVTPSL